MLSIEPHEIPPRTATLLVTPKVHVGTRIAEVRRSKSKQQLLDQEEEEAENPHNDPKRGEDDPVTTPPSNPTSPKMAGMKAIFAINQQDELRKAFAKRLGKTTAEREETTENEKKSEQKIVEEADKSTINELSANQSRDNVKQEGNTPPPIPARPPRRKDQ